MRFLTVDVEAVAIEGVETYLEPVSAPDHYKKPEAIEGFIKDAKAKQIERAALDVDLARIICLGVRKENGEIDVMRCPDERAEKYALTTLWSWYHELGTKWVTFNGLNYDLPMLLRRSLYLNILAPTIQLDRFKHPQVIDLLSMLSFDGKLKLHGLSFYANRFKLPTEPDIAGSEVGARYAAGDWEAIEKHCACDVKTTWLLAQRIGQVPTQLELIETVL